MQCSLLILTFASLVLKNRFSSLRLLLWPFLKAGIIAAEVENTDVRGLCMVNS